MEKYGKKENYVFLFSVEKGKHSFPFSSFLFLFLVSFSFSFFRRKRKTMFSFSLTMLRMLLFTKHFLTHYLILCFKQFCRCHYCSPFTDEHTEAQECKPALRANSPDVRASVFACTSLHCKCHTGGHVTATCTHAGFHPWVTK